MATYEVINGVIQGKKIGEKIEMNEDLAKRYGEKYLKKVSEKETKDKSENIEDKSENIEDKSENKAIDPKKVSKK